LMLTTTRRSSLTASNSRTAPPGSASKTTRLCRGSPSRLAPDRPLPNVRHHHRRPHR
jgi:hypothetical protein